MTRLPVLFAIALTLGGCSGLPGGFGPLSSEQIGKIATEVTVLIDGCNSGSGVLFKHEGNTYSVLTAKHTLNPDATCLIITPDGTRYNADAKTMKTPVAGVDLAVVTFTSDKNYQLAKFGDSDQVNIGKVVYVAGAAAPSEAIPNRTIVVPDGKIMGRVPQPFEGYALIYNNSTLPGMSGGAVFNEQGQVIGIHGKGDKQDGKDTGRKLGIPINTFLKPESETAKGNNPNQPKDANAYYSQGVARQEQGDLKGALEEYTEAIRIDSNYAYAYYNRGVAYYELGDKKSAIADYNQAIKINPNYANAYNNRGGIYSELGDKKSAIADYNQAIKINPNLDQAYYNRGNVYYNLGDKKSAIADYNQAIKINPNYAEAYGNRGLTYSDLGDEKGAIADYNQAIKINPNLAQVYNNRGLAYDKLGDKKTAIADYNQAIKINPNLDQAYYNRGLAYYELGNKKSAIANYNQAIQINPNYADAYFNRGSAYYGLGDKKSAIADFTQAIQINPNDAPAYGKRGITYYELGDKKTAIKDLQKAAKLYKEQGDQKKYQLITDFLNKLSPN